MKVTIDCKLSAAELEDVANCLVELFFDTADGDDTRAQRKALTKAMKILDQVHGDMVAAEKWASTPIEVKTHNLTRRLNNMIPAHLRP